MGIKVLSLFDGMSCGRIALEKLGIKVDRYVASEVDKHAIKVSRSNYPDIVQMGSVTEIEYENGQVFNWMDSTDLGKVDLFIGGSPCQNFSFSGSRKGMVTKDNVEILSLEHYLHLKEDGFEFQGQSYLFWEYVRLLREVQKENPDVLFLLENVKMAKKWQDLISSVLGVEPIIINSALVSAQNRVRLFWTNIQGITQPEDRGILLKDIIDYSVPFDRTFTPKEGFKKTALVGVGQRSRGKNTGGIHSDKSPTVTSSSWEHNHLAVFVDRDKAFCLDACYYKGVGSNPYLYFDKSRRQLVFGGAFRGRYNEDGKVAQNMELRSDGKQNCLTTVSKDSLVFTEIRPASIVGRRINDKGVQDDYNIAVPIKQTLEVQPSVKSRCLTTVEKDCLLSLEDPGRYPDAYNRPELLWRKLTPVECERLQTVPDNYTAAVSNSQRYKMLGNGWTVDVIAHILTFAKWQ